MTLNFSISPFSSTNTGFLYFETIFYTYKFRIALSFWRAIHFKDFDTSFFNNASWFKLCLTLLKWYQLSISICMVYLFPWFYFSSSFSSVQSLSRVRLFAIAWTAACQASLSIITPGVYSNSSSLSQWCHPNISSSVVPFSSCPQSFPASGSFLFSFFLYFYFLNFFPNYFISWRRITLQYCSGFCHTLTWISHGFTCVPHPEPPSHAPPHPIPLGHPSAPALSTCLMHPTWTGDLFHTW